MKIWEIAITIYCIINSLLNIDMYFQRKSRTKLEDEYMKKHIEIGEKLSKEV
jgi:hypothetical protein